MLGRVDSGGVEFVSFFALKPFLSSSLPFFLGLLLFVSFVGLAAFLFF
jgi:hypothetical protein